MRAVILVGGEGTRLRPLTIDVPKQMLPVGGRPMIEHVVEHLAAHGVDEVVLSLGFRPDAFLAAYPDGHCCGVAVRYAVEDQPLDTAGAIAFAAGSAGIDETFVVVNGDVLTDLDVGALVDRHRAQGAEATIALTPVADPSRFGVVVTDPDGRVRRFVEKPPASAGLGNLINAGTYVLEPDVLARIPGGRRVSVERETFPGLAAEGRLYAMASDGAWIDAGTPATYLAANLRHAADVALHPDADVRESWLHEEVQIGAGARVDRSVVLAGATVADGATVRDSIVGPASVVGHGAEMSELCVLGTGARVPPGARLKAARVPDLE